MRNFTEYCNRNNYELLIYSEDNDEYKILNKDRACPWFKIQLVKNLLINKNIDYIVWIDADCQILKQDIKLEYFIEKYFSLNTQAHLVVTEEIQGGISTGIMFLKKTEKNVILMDKIWNNPNINDYFKSYHEQSSYQNLLDTDEEVRKMTIRIPWLKKTDLMIYYKQYYPNKSFLIHCAGCSEDKLGLIFMMDMFNLLKMDEETDEDYNIRKKFLLDEELWKTNRLKIVNGEKVKYLDISKRCIEFIKKNDL